MSVTYTPPSADWTSGAYTNVPGTSGADTLATLSDYVVLNGFGGFDTLTSTFNQTNLNGGSGGDTLQTIVNLIDVPDILVGQFGASGNDTMTIDVMAANAIDARIEIGADGGIGHDVITVNALSNDGFNTATLAAYINGGRGNDTITSVLAYDGFSQDGLVSNFVSGGDGRDIIYVSASDAFSGFASSVLNEVCGGQGVDDIQAYASVSSNVPGTAENHVYGEGGSDTILVTIDANSNSARPVGLNYVEGGNGNDDITAVQNTFSINNFYSDLTNDLNGGFGNDTMTATLTAQAEDSAFALNDMAGAQGADVMVASITALSLTVLTAENRMLGQNNDDIMTAVIDTSRYAGSEANHSALNYLDGGVGNDVLTATLIGPAGFADPGHSELFGSGGDDVLTVIGGNNNILSGGNGNDELAGGTGDDIFTGGNNNDVFVFDIAVDQGTETITDFNAVEDALRFLGVTDAGAAGLADDLDALAAFADDGTDVTVTMSSGTVLVFENEGTGAVNSFADLVDDDLTQLLAAGDVFVFV